MLFWESSSVGRYCVIELPTVANVLVALDPMSRTVPGYEHEYDFHHHRVLSDVLAVLLRP
jgi:hypothetical protein